MSDRRIRRKSMQMKKKKKTTTTRTKEATRERRIRFERHDGRGEKSTRRNRHHHPEVIQDLKTTRMSLESSSSDRNASSRDSQVQLFSLQDLRSQFVQKAVFSSILLQVLSLLLLLLLLI